MYKWILGADWQRNGREYGINLGSTDDDDPRKDGEKLLAEAKASGEVPQDADWTARRR